MNVVDGSSRQKLRKCLVVFALGLALQAGIVFLAVPGKAQSGASVSQSAIRLPSISREISIPVSSRANVAVATPYVSLYRMFPLGTTISDTVVLGELDPGQRYLGVIANQGRVVLGGDDVASRSYTLMLDTLSPDLPLTISATVVADGVGAHLQRTRLGASGFDSIVISDSIVAQAPPLTFDVSRTYPGAVELGNVYTATWEVGASSSVITDTRITANVIGGVYESILGEPGRVFCDLGISTFSCSIPDLAPGQPAAVMTFTSRALEPGTNDHILHLLGGGESLTLTTTATVVPPPAVEITIDIKPGGDRNPINLRSHGNIPVAILSTASFDAVSQIDQASLAFGPSGTEESLLFCNPEDSNGNGLMDLVCHFDTQLASFQPGSTVGIVTGLTFGGAPIQGSDSVVIVPKAR